MPEYTLKELVEKAKMRGFKVFYYESLCQFQFQMFDKNDSHIFSQISTNIPSSDEIKNKVFTRNQTRNEVRNKIKKLLNILE